MSFYGREENKGPLRTLEAVKKELSKKVEEYLHETFNYTTVEKWVKDILRAHVNDIVMGALGFEWGHGGRGNGQWNIRTSNKETPVMAYLNHAIESLVSTHLPKITEEARPAIDKIVCSKVVQQEMLKEYKEHFHDSLRQSIRAWAEEMANMEVESVFDKHREDFMKSIKLKSPLKLGTIEETAGMLDGDEELDVD